MHHCANDALLPHTQAFTTSEGQRLGVDTVDQTDPQHPALMSLRVQWRQLGDACSLSRVFLRMILIVCLGNKFLIDDVGATHATRTFDRPSTPHPTHPYNADFVENFVLTMQKDAEQHSNALISTDDFNTPVSTGTYSDVPQHEKSLNTYQHTMAASNRREGSNFGHLYICAF